MIQIFILSLIRSFIQSYTDSFTHTPQYSINSFFFALLLLLLLLYISFIVLIVFRSAQFFCLFFFFEIVYIFRIPQYFMSFLFFCFWDWKYKKTMNIVVCAPIQIRFAWYFIYTCVEIYLLYSLLTLSMEEYCILLLLLIFFCALFSAWLSFPISLSPFRFFFALILSI